jgi:chitodextrinase
MTTATLIFFAPVAEATIYPQRSIAGVKLGMTKSQVRAKLGRPPVVSRFYPNVTYYYGRMKVKLRQGFGVVELQTTSRAERTRTGVGIGSTERQVVAGVSGILCSLWVGTIRRCRVGTGEIGRRTTDLFLMNDTVLDITIARVPDTAPPSAPSNLTVPATTKTSVSLAWTAASDNVGVRAYTLYRNGMRVGKTTDTTATIGGLSCGATDEFGVEAFDAAGNRSPRVTIRASTDPCPEWPDTTPPSAPSNLTVTATTKTSVSLAWTAASDNVGVRAYTLYRNGMPVGPTTDTTATIGGLSCGTTDEFGVDAADAAGNQSPRVTIRTSTDACPETPDTIPPSAPSNLTVTATTTTSVSLAWTAASDNVGVRAYTLYRSGMRVGMTADTTATMGGLPCGTAAEFGVDAVDAAGNQSPRLTIRISTDPCPDDPVLRNLAVSPSGSDANRCTPNAPCLTFDRVYDVARPGDVVEVASGRYPRQVITYDAAENSDDVVFRPARDATVSVAAIATGDPRTGAGAQHIEFRDMAIDFVAARRGAADLTFRNIDMRQFTLSSATNISIIGGDVGPFIDGVNHINSCGRSGCLPARNLLIDGVYIHDFGVSDEAKHSECLMVWPGQNVTIRNSRFERCKDFGILFKNYGSKGYIRDVVLENNVFDIPIARQTMPYGLPLSGTRGGYSVKFSTGGWRLENIVVRNNSFLGSLLIDSAGGYVFNARVTANVGPLSSYSCRSYIAFAYNVWDRAKCSTTDTMAPLGFVNPAEVDLRLVPSAAAIDRGDRMGYPAADIDGVPRPQGGAPDAGAYEVQ